MSNSDGFLRTWRPMRPWFACPHCQRRGAIQRGVRVKLFVSHHCPGPFVLDHVEEDTLDGAFRLTIRSGDYQHKGGDHHVCNVCRDRSGEGGGLG